MTRLEITDKAKNYKGDKLSFADGAEWMQTRMTEKACEWLKEHTWIEQGAMEVNGKWISAIEQFKQAMEK